jgi:hypothetical protein
MAAIYIDHDVAVNVARRLEALGHTATTARSLNLTGAPDGYHLLLASQSGWLLITHNRKDFELLHDAWLRWSKAWGASATHGGILVLPHGDSEANAQRVNDFIAGRSSLGNSYHEWTNAGWTPWRPRGGMVP